MWVGPRTSCGHVGAGLAIASHFSAHRLSLPGLGEAELPLGEMAARQQHYDEKSEALCF